MNIERQMADFLYFSVIFLFLLNAHSAKSSVFDGRTTKFHPPREISEKLGGADGVTFSAWIKRDAEGLNRRNEIMNLTISGTRAKAVIGFLADNTIRIGGRTHPEEPFRGAVTASQWTDEKLHHIAGVIDLKNNKARIYVDGQRQELKEEIPSFNARLFPADTGIRNTLGTGSDLKNYYKGEIRHVAVYNRALKEDEINRLHIIAQNISEDEIPSLIFLWKGDKFEPADEIAHVTKKTAPEIPRVKAVEMIKFAGSPREIGRMKAEKIGSETIRKELESYFNRAKQQKVSMEILKFYARPGIERTSEIAPHWIEEMESMAETAGVDPEKYIISRFSGLIFSGRGRGWREQCTELEQLEHECTSYAVSGEAAEGNGIFYHKTRDNVRSVQRAFIAESNLPGIYKYIQAATMYVNEKGLAMSGDYGGPRPSVPRYRGRINISRYIMENATDCEEALDILKDFVAKGWYVGGTSVGQRWTIVDRYGRILDVTNSSDTDSLKWRYIQDGGPHITRSSAKRLLETERPVSFLTFHDISRDTLVSTSISGLSVEIHPDYPEYLSLLWISFPARSLPFPLFMGGRKTPVALFDGAIDEIGNKAEMSFHEIRNLEQKLYEESKKFQSVLYEMIKEGKKKQVPGMIDDWVKNYTEIHLKALGAME